MSDINNCAYCVHIAYQWAVAIGVTQIHVVLMEICEVAFVLNLSFSAMLEA